MHQKRFAAKDIIIKAGDTGKELYLIISGRVSVYVNYGMQSQFKVAELVQDAFFGESAMFEAAPRSATIVAAENTVLQVVPLDDVAQAIELNPEIFLALIKNYYTRRQEQNRELMQVNSLVEEAYKINEESLALNANIIDCLSQIKSIARENNMLSLNAAIEAARIGELGRSFAIVANELKELATKTDTIAGQSHELINECKKNSLKSAEKFNTVKEFLAKFK